MSLVTALRNDWPLAVMVAGTLATIAVVIACLVAVTSYGRDSMSFLAAGFACFGLIKLAVGIKAVRELRRFQQAARAAAASPVAPDAVPAGAGEAIEDPRIDFGGPSRYRVYVAFKFFTAAFAMTAAIVILVHGPTQAWSNARHPAPAPAPATDR